MTLSLLHSDRTDRIRARAADAGDPIVLTFGRAPRRDPDRLSAAAGEIYRRRRAGRRVIALVPPFAAESGAAALLAEACWRIGLRAELAGPEAIGDGAADVTIVPAAADAVPPAPAPGRPVRVAIAGYGVVGQALAARLRAEPRFEFTAVLLRDPAKPRGVAPPGALTACPRTFLDTRPDIVVEALSCEATGADLCIRALAAGTSVVTASKRVVSGWKAALAAAASRGGARLAYSAAVGGGAAVLETVDRAARTGKIAAVAATLNGTANFVLGRLAVGQDLEAALAAAREAGFAEANSDFDLSGADAAAKLRIVAHHAFGIDPSALEVATEWLDAEAARRIAASGERWVQLARLERRGGALHASVTLVPAREARGLPPAEEEWNSALVTLADGRAFTCTGRGAGGAATAEAIVADLHDLAAALDRAEAAPARAAIPA